MDVDVLSVFQRTLADQCRCWGVIVTDRAPLRLRGAVPVSDRAFRHFPPPAGAPARRRAARLARLPAHSVLFCGLPVPSGATHFRTRSSEDVSRVAAEVDRVMRRIAPTVGAKLLVFKELEETFGALAETLQRAGYMHGGIPPMHLLNRSFKSFADYRDALKSRYRAQIQRSEKKLKAAGFEALSGRGAAFFDAHWNDEAHQLYVAVQSRAEQKLELMPAAFFRELAHALGDEVLLTSFAAPAGCAPLRSPSPARARITTYIRADYELNNEGDLYFNLFYNDLDQAFRSGATSVHMGQTSDSFKSRLGSSTQPLHFFVRARAPWMNVALRVFAPLAFPAVRPVRPQDVFAKD